MASTYENDLRLEEMATGENSGSWGTKTNTNLELIADAFSYGTETIADADTTITIADGAADAARSLALKINSSADLTTTRTITLAPNTTSKVWIIENNTSGGQTLTISAGSGSNITLANGKTKIIATDGIGAGSNVVELTQDIAIADLFVDDDLTVGDDIIMNSDGAKIDFGSDSEIQLTHVADTGLLLTETGGGAPTLQFRDSGLAISSSADGQLDIDSDGTIDINATTSIAFDTDTLYVDSTNDRVGVNVSSPVSPLQVSSGGNGNIIHANGASNAWDFILKGTNDGDTESVLYELGMYRADGTTNPNTVLKFGRGLGEQNGFFTIDQNGSEAMRIDSSRRVLIGGQSDTLTVGGIAALLQVENTSGSAAISIARHTASVNSGYLNFGKSRGADATIVQENDATGYIQWAGADGTDINSYTAYISSAVDGTPGSNDMPGRLMFWTTADGSSSPTERMRITNGGRVGINTVGESGTPLGYLTIDNDINSANVLTNKASYHVVLGVNGSHTGEYIGGIGFGDITQSTIQAAISVTDEGTSAAAGIAFATGNTSAVNEAMRIDSSQRVLIGHTSALTSSLTPRLQVVGTDASSSAVNTFRFGNTAFPPYYQLTKSRSTSAGSFAIVQDDDSLGQIRWMVDDGTNYSSVGASIESNVDGTPGANDTPARLVFSTTADGSSSPTERMRIDNAGLVTIGDGGGAITPLRIKKTVSDTIDLDKTSNVAPKGAWLELYNPGGTTGGGVGISALGLGTEGRYAAIAMTDQTSDNSGTGGDIQFWTSASKTGALVERMRINSNGAVGINSSGYVKTNAAQFLTLGDGASASGAGLDIIRGEALSGGTGPVIKMYHGPDSGTQVEQRIASVVGDLIISADHQDVHSGTTMEFYIDGSRKLLLNGAGNLVLNSGAGVDFSATGDGSGTETSELLDDYEEGTWSPASGNGSNPLTVMGTGNRYTKIGRQVIAYFDITWDSGNSSTSTANIAGLPYTPSSDQEGDGAATIGYITGSEGVDFVAHVSNSNPSFNFYTNGSGGSSTYAHLAGRRIAGYIQYYTA